MGEFVSELHNASMHYVLILDPGVSASEPPGAYPPFDEALQMHVLVRNASNQPFVGKVLVTDRFLM